MSATLTEIPAEPKADHAVTNQARLRRLLVMGSDLAALLCGGFVSRTLSVDWAPSLAVSLLYGITVLGWMAALRLYNARLSTNRREEFGRIWRSGVSSLLTLGLIAFVLTDGIDLRAGIFLLLASVGSLAIEREMLRAWFARRRRAGQGLWASILISADPEDGEFRQSIENDPSSPHTIVGTLDPIGIATEEELLTRVLSLARANSARGVVVVESSLDASTNNSLVRGLLAAGLHIDLASTLSDISIDRLAARTLGTSIATWIAPRPRHGWRAKAKRTFDLFVSVTALVALSPVFVTLALLVRFTSPGPVFFRQERVGRDGEPFDVLKFRSMVVDAEALLDELSKTNESDGPLFKMRADPRVTRIGRFLRKTSLDELPQLINVVKNEMSLVGPRPALRAEMAEWDRALYARLEVKPGITGMWQVSGRSGTTFSEYTRLDLYYVHNWSLLVDLTILAKTIPAVIKSDGAY